MNETKSTPQSRPDVVVDLRDLLLYILLRWRSLLAVALVAAVLLTGLVYIKDMAAYRRQLGQEPTAEVTLTENERSQAIAVQKQRTDLANARNYQEKALLMQLDPAAVPTTQLCYRIVGDAAYGVASLYRKHLTQAELFTDLPGCEDTLAACPAELLTTSLEYPETADSTANDVLLYIQVYGPTEDLCRSMAACIREEAAALAPTLRESMGAFTLSLVYDRYAVLRQTTVQEMQQTSRTKLTALQTALTASEEELSSAQRAYLSGQEDVPPGAGPAPPSFSIKMLVLGFVGGGALLALWYGLRYVFENRVQSAGDLAARYALPVLGGVAVPTEKKGSPIDRALLRLLRDPPQTLSLVEQQIALLAAESSYKKIYLAGGSLSDEEQSLLTRLGARLEEQGVTLLLGPCPPADGEALARLAGADAVLPVAKIGATSHPALQRTLALAGLLDRPVAGILLLQ